MIKAKITTPMRVFVLLFNARTENEGIHTVRIADPESALPGAGRNQVLMFESEDDATRFALMLEAQDFPPATVEAMDSEEIKEFCESADYDWKLVPDGALALPPETNVEATDWQVDAPQPADNSESDLDSIRRKLEGLL
jgi:hypothetical protein